jgi:hypothetical protein
VVVVSYQVSLFHIAWHDHVGFRVVKETPSSSSPLNQHETYRQGSTKAINQSLGKTGISFCKNLPRRKRFKQERLLCVADNLMYVVMHVCMCCIKCTIKYNKTLVLCFVEMLHALLVQLGMHVRLIGAE